MPAVDGIPVSIDLDDYLTDPNSDILTITREALPTGTSFDPFTNIVNSVPSIDNTGDTILPFTVTDSNGGTITLTVTIQAVNPGPEAFDATVSGAFGSPTIINPLVNDIDPDGDDLTIVEINGQSLTPGVAQTIDVTNGLVSVGIDGSVAITQATGFKGLIGIPYTVADADGATDTAIHAVIFPNDLPAAFDETVVGRFGEPVIIDPLANDIDLNGDTLTITEINGVTISPGVARTFPVRSGAMTVTVDGTITLTPDAGFSGEINVPYTIVDEDGARDSAIHRIQIPNATPVAVDETIPGISTTPIVIDPLDNNSDPDGDRLAIAAINGVPLTPGLPQTITIANGSVAVAIDGTITVSPDVSFSGDIDVPYTIADKDGATAAAIVTVVVPNSAPIAVDDTVTTDFEIPVEINPLANDTDAEGDELSITELNGITLIPGVAQTIVVPNGTVTKTADGTITVTPQPGFAGDITIPYTIDDGIGGSDASIHTVNVGDAPPQEVIEILEPGSPVIEPVNPENILVAAVDGQAITIDISEHMTDANGDPVTIDPTLLPAGSTFDPLSNELTFVPELNNSGATLVPLTVTDSAGNEINPTITIQPVSAEALANSEKVDAPYGQPVIVEQFITDTDADGDPLVLAGPPLLMNESAGTLMLDGENWMFIPASGFSDDVGIIYTLQDMSGKTEAFVLTVTIAGSEPVSAPAFAPILPTIIAENRATAVTGKEYHREFLKPLQEVNSTVLSLSKALNGLNNKQLFGTVESDIAAVVSEYSTSEKNLNHDESVGRLFDSSYRDVQSFEPPEEDDKLSIDTHFRDNKLSVIVRSTTLANRSDSVVARSSTTLANGQPLPVWISEVSDGEYLIDRSIDVEKVVLKIKEHRESGPEIIRYIEIDTLTGQVTEQ